MVDTTSKRQELCEQMAALLAAHEVPMNNEVMVHMEPLLSGSVHYAGHRAVLETRIRELES